MVNLKGTWSHDEAFPAFSQSTDVYRFVSLLQCTVLPARSNREMDMYFSTVSVRMLESRLLWWILILLYTDIICSLFRQIPLR